MGDQICAFAEGLLPLYVGWTDSFRFEWGKDDLIDTSVVPLNKRQSKVKTIGLGRCPRDMRYPRTSLVDGWLMTFPNKHAADRLGAALRFAHWFLQSAQQGPLLRRGFPSASGATITEEIESLSTRRLTVAGATGLPAIRSRADRSLVGFLGTMKSAVFDGRWVASPKTGVYEAIVATISKLIKAEATDVEGEMRILAATVRNLLDDPIGKR